MKQSTTQRSIPSLDGLRALSITLVLVSHWGLRTKQLVAAVGNLGVFGVRIFFVISGFLITSLLLKELSKSGTISLRIFYARRAMRLFPAAYAFVAVVALAWPKMLHPHDVACAVTYTMNYCFGRSILLGHLWSLAVEEQFYLLWPAVLLWAGSVRANKILIGVMIAAPFIRLASPYIGAPSEFLIYSDSLAAGCLLAINQRLLRLRFAKWGLLFAVAVHYIPSTKFSFLLGQTLENVMIALFIPWVIENRGYIYMILNWKPIAIVGVLSYSIYLWQQPFLYVGVVDNPMIAIFCTILAATASYWLIEQPGLIARDWLTRRPPLLINSLR